MLLLSFLTAFIGYNHALFTAKDAIYNETEARMMLSMAAAAYSTDPHGCIDSLESNIKLLHSFSVKCDFAGNPCSGFIAVSQQQNHLTIVYRGTKTKTQLLIEGWTTLKPTEPFYNLGMANLYFKRGHDLSWPTVLDAINDPQYKNYDIYITGHSLGGALAALAAARIVGDGLRQSNQVKITTFGEPRVGNLDFSKSFDRLVPYSFRIVNSIDIVPHLPACVKDLSYTPKASDNGSMPCDPISTVGGYHHGLEIWYPNGMEVGAEYRICDGLPKNEDFSCSNAAKVRFDDTTQAIWDHRNYFGVKVPSFGKGSCDPGMVFAGPPESGGLRGVISSFFG